MIFYLYFCNIKTTIQTKEQSKGEKQPFFLNRIIKINDGTDTTTMGQNRVRLE